MRQNKPVTSDTIFAEIPAVDNGGIKMTQIFVGWCSLVVDVFRMQTKTQIGNTLEGVIRKRGAMDKLITDSRRVEISKRVQEILRALVIDDWQSKSHY